MPPTDSSNTISTQPARPRAGIVPHGIARFEYQANGRRVAVFDELSDARLFHAAPAVLAALRDLLERVDYLTPGNALATDPIGGLLPADAIFQARQAIALVTSAL